MPRKRKKKNEKKFKKNLKRFLHLIKQYTREARNSANIIYN